MSKTQLQQIKIGYTTGINGHVVTRWSESAFEVDTWGVRTVDIEKAVEWVRLPL